MKILFVLTSSFHPNKGGVQMTTCKLSRYFTENGHFVGVFSFAAGGHAEDLIDNFYHATNEGGVDCPENLGFLEAVVGGLRPDVIINQMPYEHSITKVLKQSDDYLLIGCLRNTLYSVKLNLDSYVIQNIPRSLRPVLSNPVGKAMVLARHRRRHKRDLSRILENYNRFVMFGPPNLEELEYFVPGFDRSRVALIPNSIPQVSSEVPAKQKRILWLGRVERGQKRADLLPELWSLIHARLPDWELDVVGSGEFLDEVKTAVERRRLPRVLFHGRQVPDDFYKRSPIFMMTSAFEGFPNTLIEAQSYGAVPVIFDSYPIASWLVEDGVNGFLIPPFDVRSMADRIVTMASSQTLESLGVSCLKNARRFEIAAVGRQWERLFKDATVDRASSRTNEIS
jgi:glycosyltransferase involved in cell wall biosynthesis